MVVTEMPKMTMKGATALYRLQRVTHTAQRLQRATHTAQRLRAATMAQGR